jgi:CBS-domain-containing membrane protein
MHARRRFGAVLVTVGDHHLLGIFTGRDAVHCVLAEGKSAARTKLAEVMTRDPDTMPPGKTTIEALRLMEDRRYRHVPIVDAGKVIGIVSRVNFSGIELDRLDEETGLWKRIWRPKPTQYSRGHSGLWSSILAIGSRRIFGEVAT